jgi:hypothetical protein
MATPSASAYSVPAAGILYLPHGPNWPTTPTGVSILPPMVFCVLRMVFDVMLVGRVLLRVSRPGIGSLSESRSCGLSDTLRGE